MVLISQQARNIEHLDEQNSDCHTGYNDNVVVERGLAPLLHDTQQTLIAFRCFACYNGPVKWTVVSTAVKRFLDCFPGFEFVFLGVSKYRSDNLHHEYEEYEYEKQSQHALGLLHRPAASEEADDEEQGSGGDDRVDPVPDARIVGYQILERFGSLQRPHAQAHHASTAQKY